MKVNFVEVKKVRFTDEGKPALSVCVVSTQHFACAATTQDFALSLVGSYKKGYEEISSSE